jgi:hypothetical protein
MRKTTKSPSEYKPVSTAHLKIEYQSFKCPKYTVNNHKLCQINSDSEMNSKYEIRGCDMQSEYSALN